MLERAGTAWTLDEAEAWWGRYERRQHARVQGTSAQNNAGAGPADSQDSLAVGDAATVNPTFERTTIYEASEESEPKFDSA